MDFRPPRSVRMTGLPQFPPVQSKSSRIVDVTVKPNIMTMNDKDNMNNGGPDRTASRPMSSPVSTISVDDQVVRRLEEKIQSLSDQIKNLSNIHQQSINHLSKQLMITNKKLEIAQQRYAERQVYSPTPTARTPEPIPSTINNNNQIPATTHQRLHTPTRETYPKEYQQRQHPHQQHHHNINQQHFRDQIREPIRATYRMPPTNRAPPPVVKLESAPMPSFNYYDRGDELDMSYASEDYIKKHVLNKL